ncbi:30S ribosomal protein S5 [Candidatus Peregrinibacteria bacterium HGW-Peregrinibacteria-1]|jgi:small subunit ribosomal protein S5|nr:MAG: 30S ribosomal protein S5 [Candidatus Peregrinibacteria bacterium HGW-Peregrinibacteria-1]
MSRSAHKNPGKKSREPKEFEESVIQIDRVTKVVKGGRRLRFRATVVIGNKRGKIGIGIGKSHEVTGAIQKGIAKAKKDMIDVILDGTTIPHDIKLKYKAAKILLMPASEGTGIIAGGTIRKVLELAGVQNILSKSFGTTNKVNTTKAAFEALKRLKETPYMEKRKAKAAAAKAPKPVQKAPATSTPAPEAKKPVTENKQAPAKKPTTKPSADKKPAAKATSAKTDK